jgi:hypothetical protein
MAKKEDNSTGWKVYDAIHGGGKAALTAFGMGGIADAVGDLTSGVTEAAIGERTSPVPGSTESQDPNSKLDELSAKVDTLIADNNSNSSIPVSASLSNPIPPTDWSSSSIAQSPNTNGTGGGSPTFNPRSAQVMNAVSDPNQVSPGLPFYQNT